MQTILVALLWESLRISFWRRLMLLAGIVAGSMVFVGFLNGRIERGDPALFPLFRYMIAFVSTLGAILTFGDQAKLSHHFRLPLKTSTIVHFRLIYASLRGLLETVIYIEAMNLTVETQWPFAGPCLFSITTAIVLVSLLWIAENSIGQCLILLLLVAPLWICQALQPWPGTSPWPTPNLVMIATSLCLGGAAHAMCLYFIRRNRYGDTFHVDIRRLRAVLDAWRGDGATNPFRNAHDAADSYLQRIAGWIIPVFVVFAHVYLLPVMILEQPESRNSQAVVFATAALTIIACGFPAALLGGIDNKGGRQPPIQFLLTRPLTNWEIARSVQRVLTRGILIAGGVWVVSSLLYRVWLIIKGVPIEETEFVWGAAGVLAFFVAAWTLSGSCATLALSGRPWTLLMLIGPFPWFFMIARFVDQEWGFSTEKLTLIIAGIGLIVLTVASLAHAARHEQMSKKTTAICAGVWCAVVAIALTVSLAQPLVKVEHYLLMIGVAGLVVLPIPAMPVTIGWNRAR